MSRPDSITGRGAKGHWTDSSDGFRRCRLGESPLTDETPLGEIRALAAYKSAIDQRRSRSGQVRLKPYWGKPTVRNFREGEGNEVHDLMAVCHATRKGRYIGSHWS